MPNSMKVIAGLAEQSGGAGKSAASSQNGANANASQPACGGVFKAGLRLLTDPSMLTGKLPTGVELLKKLSS